MGFVNLRGKKGEGALSLVRGVGLIKARQGWGRTMTHTKTRRTFRHRQATYRRAIQQDSLKRGDDRPGTIGLPLDRQNRRGGTARTWTDTLRVLTPPPFHSPSLPRAQAPCLKDLPLQLLDHMRPLAVAGESKPHVAVLWKLGAVALR